MAICLDGNLGSAQRAYKGRSPRSITRLPPAIQRTRMSLESPPWPHQSLPHNFARSSVTHVPAAEQGPLLARIGIWLKSGGIFVGSFGADEAHDWTGEWLGTEMFFGHNDKATNLALVRQAGLESLRVEPMRQDNENARFLWILARKL